MPLKKIRLLLMAVFFLFINDPAHAKVWNYTQLDLNSTGNGLPSMNGSDLVWNGTDEKGRYGVFHYSFETGEVQSLTHGVILGHTGMPSVSNGQVAFRIYDRKDTFTYYLYSLADNTYQAIYSGPTGPFEPYWGYEPSYHSTDPMLNNGQIVFAAWDGTAYQIMSWKDGELTQITNTTTDNYEPQIWNGTISWTGYGDNPANKQEVFYYNGTEIIQITDRIGKDEDSYLGYDKLAFAGLSFEDSGHYKTNIYVYDPETGELERLIDVPDGNNYEPVIYENTYAWHTQINVNGTNKYLIRYYDGYKLDTLNNLDENISMAPFLYQDKVAYSWFDDDGIKQLMIASYKTGGYNPTSSEGSFHDAVFNNNYAYVAQGFNGIGVYDLSDPAKPVKLSGVASSGEAFDLAQDGDKIFSASRAGGVDVYQTQTNGTLSQVTNVAVNGSATKLLISKEKQALFVAGSGGGLSAIDISGDSYEVLCNLALPGNAMGLAIQGDIAYVAGYAGGLHVVDINVLTDMALFTSISTSAFGYAWDVQLNENTLFLSVLNYGLVAYSLDNPYEPSLLGSIELPKGEKEFGWGWDAAFEMFIRNNYAFVASGTEGFFVIDISDASNMKILERYETPGFVWSVELFERYLFALDGTGGFNLYDVTDYFPELARAQTPIPATLPLILTGISVLILKRRKLMA